ncbi:MAG TPA: polysaccharide deacetylase family protein [Thermodesulfovibrionales bacterium]|nr:polysaccharide deacetylase family protein [Thermodesulfovibrionales bacterium]
MHISKSTLSAFLFLFLILSLLPAAVTGSADAGKGPAGLQVPILLYHRFGPVVADSMTVTTPVFQSHLKYLKDNGYTVIPLKQLVDYLLRKGPPPPARSVVIVVDDGHKSVYTDMLPLVKEYNIPVTLFIYPSAISTASYAMTWEHLRELKKAGLFDFQSHTYWHPNFKKEKKKLSPAEYDKFVDMQLRKSKEKIEKELALRVTMLAWPFGIDDDGLLKKASEAGYLAAFSIERHHASISDNIMALPRYLMVNTDRGRSFESLLAGSRQDRIKPR